MKFQFDVIEIRFCVFVGKNSGNQFIESLLKTQPELRVLQKPPEKQSGYSIRGIAVIAIINSIGKDIKIHILEARIAIESGARIIGVNNRNLKDFTVDTGNSARLKSLVGDGIIFVSESGVKDGADVAKLKEAGVDAVLVGEALMRAPDKKAKLSELRGE